MEIYKLPKRTLKIVVIKVLSILRKVMHEQSDKFNKEINSKKEPTVYIGVKG